MVHTLMSIESFKLPCKVMYTQTDLNAIALFGKLQLQVILYPQKVSFKDMSLHEFMHN